MKSWITFILTIFGGFGLYQTETKAVDSPSVQLGIYSLFLAPTVNLSLNDDGTFFWNVCGGDYQSFSEGNWVSSGQTLLLFPGPSNDRLPWPIYFGTRASAASVVVEGGPLDGEITVTGDAQSADSDVSEARPFKQIWSAGRVCDIWWRPPNRPGGPDLIGQRSCSLPLIKERPCQDLLPDVDDAQRVLH